MRSWTTRLGFKLRSKPAVAPSSAVHCLTPLPGASICATASASVWITSRDRTPSQVARFWLSASAMSSLTSLGTAVALSVALGLASHSAHATPIPMLRQTASGGLSVAPAHPGMAGLKAPPHHSLSAPPFKSTRVLETNLDLSLDPTSGQVDGTLTMKLKAEQGSVGSFAFFLDQGLSVTSASAPGSTVTPAAQPYPPLSWVTFTVSPPLVAGEVRDVTVQYSGIVQCKGSPGSSMSDYCSKGPPLGVMMEGSALPSLVDQDSLGGYNLWSAKRSLVLHMPSGIDVVAAGQKTQDTDDGTTRTTRWEVPGYHTAGPYLILFGELTSTAVPGTTPTTTLYVPTSLPSWQSEMSGWMTSILPFLDQQTGGVLPFKELQVMKLPSGWTLPGTAGDSFVLLAENYGDYGAEYFEETLAHETSHEWWGILVAPTDLNKTRWLTEGLATLTQIDYSAAKFAGGLDRDSYLARRYNEHAMVLRYMAQPTLPPLVAPSPQSVPQDQVQTTIWAYIRSSATLDHLRLIIGEDAFAAALKDYVSQCSKAHCDTADFQKILEAKGSRDLTSVFASLVYDTTLTEPVLNFSQEKSGEGVKLTISSAGATGVLPLEFVITYRDGSKEKRLLELPGDGQVEVLVSKPVLAVRPNRRHDAVVWSRSAQPGDIDFDQEVDGLDVIHCAWRQGKSSGTGVPGGEGAWRLDLDFDSRCDENKDGTLQGSDLQTQLANFASLRQETL